MGAMEYGKVDGLIPHLVDGDFFLEYADDTIIFMEHDLEKTLKAKSNRRHPTHSPPMRWIIFVLFPYKRDAMYTCRNPTPHAYIIVLIARSENLK
jgi:hypothetical protein